MKVKESTQSPFKYTNLEPNWVQTSLSLPDAFGRTGLQYFKEHNIEFVYNNESADYGFSIHGNKVKGVPKNRCILFRVEPPIYKIFFGYRVYYGHFQDKYMRVMSIVEDDYPAVHFNLPTRTFQYTDMFFDTPKPKFLCMILKNKKISNIINSLNSHSLLEYRENCDDMFCRYFSRKYHSYGVGWNPKCFQGSIPGSVPNEVPPVFSVLSQYRFNFCPENSKYPGYVNEKPIHAMVAGCVPVYAGAPDAEHYLSGGTFIDAEKYTPVELCNHLINLSDEEYLKYRTNIRNFLKSDYTNNFSSYVFAQKIVKILEET